ncbi:conserved hypothetical protein [Cellulomonas flavigena DSM 20109]|uniref:Uncharacterized protein n=1 Tax=Cellulomonas flavigena (strain ATCC 482 / DSM 20109 / BCRC 11376 / JCM 18109 / NBRC 3775 / NCIMB 8073 / NRS 134) TaxID=446466 RepID=D5UHG4_CELFN|nr:hypothetical protein [Cellulomonas flavigena]ADG75285.1 conserved hypothetical protein [Cellulomonas flavigena DSM 20109]
MSRTPGGRLPVPDPAAPGPASVPPDAPRPRALAVACGLVLLEAVLLVAAAVVGLVALVPALAGGGAGPVLFLVAVALGAATLLSAAARGLWAGRRWGRAPVVTAQVFVVVTAVGWWGAGGGPWAVVPLVVAVAVAGTVLSPVVVAATTGTRDPAP